MRGEFIVVDTIVFDLDGTLLDTIGDLAASTNYALCAKGYPQRTVGEIRQMVGNGIRKLVLRAVPEATSESDYEETFGLFRAHYLKHCAELTRPYEGITELVARLAERSYKMAIVSNKLQPAVSELAARFFDPYIQCAIGESPGTPRKPDPTALRQALEALGSTPATTLYVGDSEVDMATGHNAGVEVVSCSWGFRSREALAALNPRYLIDKPEELLHLLI